MRRALALVVLLLAACKPADQTVAIRFVPVAESAPIGCTVAAAGRTLADLRFFVHDVSLVAANGQLVPVALDTAPPWQSPDVVLIDLEDGQGTCDTGSPATHTAITGHAPAGHYVGLRFALGVPFPLNHADPALAKAPLDQTAMHWHWLAGYKFLRAAVRNGDGIAWLHLGSTGCEGRIGAVTGCSRPNRPQVVLAAFDPAKDVVAVDVGALFAETIGARGDRSCQSEPDNADCALMMRHLGLGDAAQDVFRAMAQ